MLKIFVGLSKSNVNQYTMAKPILLLVFITFIIGCNPQKRSAEWDRDNVIKVKNSDTRYTEAAKLAQENMPAFIQLLNSKEKKRYKFSISGPYTEEGHTEQMWFKVVSIEGNMFIATLNNVPLRLKNIKLGDQVKISKDSVKDWIVSRKHKVVIGNYL